MSYYVYKYIELYLQWDPYPFLFGSPARYDTSVCLFLNRLTSDPLPGLLISASRLDDPQLPLQLSQSLMQSSAIAQVVN
jgi:hypothetical protein